ncbi:long-chain fatty acid transport protein 4 [Agrilus planipennis]|uniref:Very long-chain fatty acid transport protein n=1 Tax=Agrilus planipennis TaxID=224129 RepID=A0A7F5R847_AGRPL|nr:long-chain fatty acid transport protein 4 [Agrilus planipennis]
MWVVLLIIASIIIYLIKSGWLDILKKTYKRDLRAVHRFTRLNWTLRCWQQRQLTVVKRFLEVTKKHPEKVAFRFEDDVWTFRQVDEYSNKVANYFKQEGFVRGETVALYLESRPEYVCLWLGLSKIGVVTALINTNLVSDPFVHSVQVAESKAIIYGSGYSETITNVSKKLSGLKLYQFHEDLKKPLLNGSVDLRAKLEESSPNYVKDIAEGKTRDKVLYIYTSGTTGLPKAAVITNVRYFMLTMGVYSMSSMTEDDVVYDPLPLYHSAGGILGVGQCLLNGLTVAIRKKFSASNFWKDCIKYRCTAAQYIGETCRYILASTKDDKEHDGHSVKIIYGNGLRPQIWTKFVTTFNIEEVYEFYGATEGNTNLINIDSTPGAIGFVPRYAHLLYPVALVKCDSLTGEPIRNENGCCIHCKPNEAGVLFGKINHKKAFFSFSGYADPKATQKKIVQNVFKKGDFYFNSGDILEYDDYGYYYFKDRTGDTFRWKGENVSTSEIEAVISNTVELKDAVVFGVEVPHTEGKAGMVAIVDLTETLNINELSEGLRAHLPGYAIPLFVRVMHSVPMTGTYKLKKKELRDDGYDLNKVTDKIYFYNSKEKQYVRFTPELYEKLKEGKLSL